MISLRSTRGARILKRCFPQGRSERITAAFALQNGAARTSGSSTATIGRCERNACCCCCLPGSFHLCIHCNGGHTPTHPSYMQKLHSKQQQLFQITAVHVFVRYSYHLKIKKSKSMLWRVRSCGQQVTMWLFKSTLFTCMYVASCAIIRTAGKQQYHTY